MKEKILPWIGYLLLALVVIGMIWLLFENIKYKRYLEVLTSDDWVATSISMPGLNTHVNSVFEDEIRFSFKKHRRFKLHLENKVINGWWYFSDNQIKVKGGINAQVFLTYYDDYDIEPSLYVIAIHDYGVVFDLNSKE